MTTLVVAVCTIGFLSGTASGAGTGSHHGRFADGSTQTVQPAVTNANVTVVQNNISGGQVFPDQSAPADITPYAGATNLSPGQYLQPGQQIESINRAEVLTMQTDGNLVLYGYQASSGTFSAPLWSSATNGNPNAFAVFQTDQNFVVYRSDGYPLWSSGTRGTGATTLNLQGDGNLVMYNPGPVWQTATSWATDYGQPRGNGSFNNLNPVNNTANGNAPDVVTMNEVCWDQAWYFTHVLHPTWSSVFITTKADKEALSNGRNFCPIRSATSDRPFGELIVSRWSLSNVQSRCLEYDAGGNRLATCPGGVGVQITCVDLAKSSAPLTSCTTHLPADAPAGQNANSLGVIRAFLGTYPAGRVVTLSGDLNTQPNDGGLDNIYRETNSGSFTGAGNFLEADQTNPGFAVSCNSAMFGFNVCRSGAATADNQQGNVRKIDYIFGDWAHVKPRLVGDKSALSLSLPQDGFSEHRVLLGVLKVAV